MGILLQMPPPGAAGPFMPNFMAPGMQPSMIIRKLYFTNCRNYAS